MSRVRIQLHLKASSNGNEGYWVLVVIVQSRLTLCDPMDCSTPGFPVPPYLLVFAQLMSIELVMPSNHLILCHPLLLPSIFPSCRVFPNELAPLIRWPNYWRFSFSLSPSTEYSGLISSRIDQFDLLAVQGTLKSLLQHHNSKASSLWHSTFFTAQLSHLYITAEWEQQHNSIIFTTTLL